jgi:quercetin dioxygenase-like cupin family protein
MLWFAGIIVFPLMLMAISFSVFRGKVASSASDVSKCSVDKRRLKKMVRAFKLYTGADKASHVLEGTIDEKDRTDVVAIHFKESPAKSSYEWHPDPEPQFVITLSGTLEFATPDGETFVLRPGDILLAEDHIGKGHKWRLIDDQPWRRAYVVLKPGAKDSFVPDRG